MKRYVAGLALVAAVTACSSGGDSQGLDKLDRRTPSVDRQESPSALFTLAPPSKTPLSGELSAYLGQSSRDVALNRFQVWIRNGLDQDIRPRRIVYSDTLLSRPERAGRLRSVPSGSYRGFTLDLIEPRCNAKGTRPAVVTVDYGTDEVTIPVEDETHVTGRWAEERCAERAIDRVATLEWTGVRVEGSGKKAIGLFQLTATPTGSGGSFTVDTVTGTPLYTSAEGDAFEVHQEVRGTGAPVTMELRARPARCDIHAFGAASGGTTFFVNVTIDGRPSQIRLAMSPEVTDQTYAYAGEVCGF